MNAKMEQFGESNLRNLTFDDKGVCFQKLVLSLIFLFSSPFILGKVKIGPKNAVTESDPSGLNHLKEREKPIIRCTK